MCDKYATEIVRNTLESTVCNHGNLLIELPFYNLSNDELNSLLMGELFNKIELHNYDLMDFLIRVRKDENFQKLNFDYYNDDSFNTMVRNISKLIDISVFH